jgi:hypothetical protein
VNETISDLRPGDIGFGPIKGGAGLLVNAGQLLLGEGFRVGRLDIRHVFVVTEAATPYPNYGGLIGDGVHVVEAMPNGAKEQVIGASRWTGEYAYVRLTEDYPGQAEDAAAIARAMIGTPYSFASYAALAAWRFGIKTPRLEKWIGRRKSHAEIPGFTGRPQRQLDENRLWTQIALPREAICSVLADQAWSLAGKRIFTDDRPQQVVTPGALAGRLLRLADAGRADWIYP